MAYELRNGSSRLVWALYNRLYDPEAIAAIAAATNYLPEQLEQDIQALHDIYKTLPKEEE